MNTSTYENILNFSQHIMTHNLQYIQSENYIDHTLSLLEDYFQFSHICMSSLSNTGVKELNANFITHHIPYTFIQELLENTYAIDLSSDVYHLADQHNYKSSTLFKSILKPFGYTDMIIQFIKPQNCQQYLSCLILLQKKSPFKKETLDLLKAIEPFIALSHLQNINNGKLHQDIQKASQTMNHYPMGIMYISQDHKVIHTNDIAQKYLADFGITHPYLYNTFFTNHLHAYYMKTLRQPKNSLPLRIGNYLFSIEPSSYLDNSCPAFHVFAQYFHQDKDVPTNEATAYVYIIHNAVQHTSLSTSSLEDKGLTKREIEITELVSQGLNNIEIAEKMNISENTVKTHLAHIYKKLNINYRIELINYVHQNYKRD